MTPTHFCPGWVPDENQVGNCGEWHCLPTYTNGGGCPRWTNRRVKEPIGKHVENSLGMKEQVGVARGQTYALILGQFTQLMQDKMKQDGDWNVVKTSSDTLRLYWFPGDEQQYHGGTSSIWFPWREQQYGGIHCRACLYLEPDSIFISNCMCCYFFSTNNSRNTDSSFVSQTPFLFVLGYLNSTISPPLAQESHHNHANEVHSALQENPHTQLSICCSNNSSNTDSFSASRTPALCWALWTWQYLHIHFLWVWRHGV